MDGLNDNTSAFIWQCVHCRSHYQGAVAAQLGQRGCYWHPGTAYDTYSCCNTPVVTTHALSRGCTRCDHLPVSVFSAASPDRRELSVPAFTLRPGTVVVSSEYACAPHMLALVEAKTRASPTWWQSLDDVLVAGARARVEATRAAREQLARQTARSISWQPYVPPPEAPVATRGKVVTSAEHAARRELAIVLTRHWRDPYWRIDTRAVDSSCEDMAGELRAVSVAWATVAISD